MMRSEKWLAALWEIYNGEFEIEKVHVCTKNEKPLAKPNVGLFENSKHICKLGYESC